MEGNKSLPLFVVELLDGIASGVLGIVDFYAFAFDHDEAGVDAFYFDNQLLFGYRTCFRLFDEIGRCIGSAALPAVEF